MASVTSTQDDKPPIDQTLERVAEAALRARKPIRIRLQPDLYDQDRPAYTTWQGLSWFVDVETVEEGRRLREGLTAFFKVFGASAQMQRAMLATLITFAEDGK